MDLNCALLVAGFAFLFSAMFLGYKIRWDKRGAILEKNDKKQEKKDQEHETRIKKIEDKNGDEQHQIDELKESNKELKAELAEVKKDKGELKDLVIKLQDRIISCEKQNGHKEPV